MIDYDKAIEINPSYSEVFVEKGILQESLHKFKDAEKCYDEAIKYNSLDPIPKFNKSLLIIFFTCIFFGNTIIL